MKSLSFFALLFAVAFATIASAQSPAPTRPRITGVSHAAFYVSDMTKARAFYEQFLGYASPYTLPRKNGGELVAIKINDRQAIELFPGSEVAPGSDRMYHFAIEVEDAEAMRVYLAAKGVTVPPRTGKGKTGNANYFIHDPNGNTVEIVQYLSDGWTVRDRGKFMPETRIATRMSHVGVVVGQFEASMAFYRDILGFREIWRGSSNGKTLSWVNLQVPEGDDYIEFMLYEKYPTTDRIRTMQHICLEVPDVAKAGAVLTGRDLPEGCKPPTPMKAGVNGKRQINYFDPDGTRIEIMEPSTIDGKPRPSSKAPVPISEPKPAAT